MPFFRYIARFYHWRSRDDLEMKLAENAKETFDDHQFLKFYDSMTQISLPHDPV